MGELRQKPQQVRAATALLLIPLHGLRSLTPTPSSRSNRLAALTRGGAFKLDNFQSSVGSVAQGGVGEKIVQCVSRSLLVV